MTEPLLLRGPSPGADRVAPSPRRRPASAPRPLRILVASHSHPEVSKGGAEITAFHLFSALQARTDCIAWFLGCNSGPAADRPGAVLTQPYSPAEYIYCGGGFDWFKFANQDPRFRGEIEALFRELAPDVVHFHHYANFGVEVFQHLRRVRPDCKIVLTLHEYLAICHHFGQMVTTKHHSLCYQSGTARCQRCFPGIARSEFFLRERYIHRFFALVDTFIAPSRFLADRYIAWGLPAAKIVVIENAMPQADVQPKPVPADGVLRIGFFGQISSLKGIDVVFDAAVALIAENFAGVTFEIFGEYRGQPPEFQAAFLQRLAGATRNVRFNGPYDGAQVGRLMQSVHAVLVPSVWWENSPLVIQEALRVRRPVICSDIGGMAEKVRDGIDGFHFPAGHPMALAALLRSLAEDRARLTDMAAAMTGRPALEASVGDYLAVYRRDLVRG